MGSIFEHQELVKNFTTELYKKYDDIFVLPITNGLFRSFDDPDRIVRSGITGVLDLLVLGPQFYLFFDGKTGGAVFSKDQKRFCERMEEINKHKVTFKLKTIEQGLEVVEIFRTSNDTP